MKKTYMMWMCTLCCILAYQGSAVSEEGMEKIAFCGVAASPVHKILAEQLDLAPELGLVIEHVSENSPAEKAGLGMYDILVKLDDQFIINFHQLSVLIKMKTPGDTVRVTFMRGGKEQEAEITLGTRVAPVRGRDELPGPAMLRHMFPRFIDEDKLEAMLARQNIKMTDKMREKLKEQNLDRFGHGEGVRILPGNIMKNTHRTVMKTGNKTTLTDREHVLEVTEKDGGKYLTAKDREGNIIFEGSIAEKEDRVKVPEEILEKLANSRIIERDPETKRKMEEEKNKKEDEIF